MQRIAKNVDRRILKVRHGKELSQESFAGRLGITQPHLSNLEGSIRNPSHALLRLIAFEFQINLGWLISGRNSA